MRHATGTVRWNSMAGTDIQALIRVDPVRSPKDTTLNQPLFRSLAELQTISVSGARSVFPVRRLGQSQPAAYTRGATTVGGSLIFSQFSRDVFADVRQMSGAGETYDRQEPAHPFTLPEFDIVILGANEFGTIANAIIGGVTLTNFGTTLSVHDVYTEVSYSYVARYYVPLGEDVRKIDQVRKLLLAPRPSAASTAAAKGVTAPKKGPFPTSAAPQGTPITVPLLETQTETMGQAEAIAWVESSVYDAYCHKAFDHARSLLPDTLPENPAVVLDIDETALSGVAFQQYLLDNGIPYSADVQNEFLIFNDYPCVPGAKRFLDTCHDRGIEVIFVTGRKEFLRDSTIRQLNHAALPVDTVYMRQEGQPSDKDPHFVTIQAEKNVVLFLGDKMDDFPNNTYVPGKTVLLPNPLY